MLYLAQTKTGNSTHIWISLRNKCLWDLLLFIDFFSLSSWSYLFTSSGLYEANASASLLEPSGWFFSCRKWSKYIDLVWRVLMDFSEVWVFDFSSQFMWTEKIFFWLKTYGQLLHMLFKRNQLSSKDITLSCREDSERSSLFNSFSFYKTVTSMYSKWQ